MKYMMICYSEHDNEIAEHKLFDSPEEAIDYMTSDINKTYRTEKFMIESDSCHKIIDGMTGMVESCSGEYRWTWPIFEVEV